MFVSAAADCCADGQSVGWRVFSKRYEHRTSNVHMLALHLCPTLWCPSVSPLHVLGSNWIFYYLALPIQMDRLNVTLPETFQQIMGSLSGRMSRNSNISCIACSWKIPEKRSNKIIIQNIAVTVYLITRVPGYFAECCRNLSHHIISNAVSQIRL